MRPAKQFNLPWVIGGHDAAAILGRSRYKTPLRVWAEKLGKVEREDLSGSPVIQRGHALEPHLLSLYARATGRKLANQDPSARLQKTYVYLPGAPAKVTERRPLLVQHKGYPWAVAPRDAIAIADDGTEIDVDAKSVNLFMRELWGEPREQPADAPPIPTATEIPLEEAIQLQHYMWVTGNQTASFAIGIVDDRIYREPVSTEAGVIVFGLIDFLWCDMKRRPDFIAAMSDKLIEFVGYLKSGKRPPDGPAWTDHDWFADLVGVETAKKEIDLGSKGAACVSDVHSAMNMAELAEQKKKQARVELMDLMGDAAVGLIPAGDGKKKRVHFKTQTTKARVIECEKCGHGTAITKERSGRVLRTPNREKQKP